VPQKKKKVRKAKQVLSGGHKESVKKDDYVVVYENGTMRPVETVLRWREGR
jgi:hypothetical protein